TSNDAAHSEHRPTRRVESAQTKATAAGPFHRPDECPLTTFGWDKFCLRVPNRASSELRYELHRIRPDIAHGTSGRRLLGLPPVKSHRQHLVQTLSLCARNAPP